jgi:hypothetical protein
VRPGEEEAGGGRDPPLRVLAEFRSFTDCEDCGKMDNPTSERSPGFKADWATVLSFVVSLFFLDLSEDLKTTDFTDRSRGEERSFTGPSVESVKSVVFLLGILPSAGSARNRWSKPVPRHSANRGRCVAECLGRFNPLGQKRLRGAGAVTPPGRHDARESGTWRKPAAIGCLTQLMREAYRCDGRGRPVASCEPGRRTKSSVCFCPRPTSDNITGSVEPCAKKASLPW